MTVEKILQKHFKCRKPFLKIPKLYKDGDCGNRYEYMTQHGHKTYNKLVSLIYDLGDLGVGIDANHVIETLDNIISEKEY